MKKINNRFMKIFGGLIVFFFSVLLGSISAESIYASSVTFIQDSITIGAGDEVYLPYLLSSYDPKQELEYYTDDSAENPIIIIIEDEKNGSITPTYNTVMAVQPGTVTLHAVAPNGDSDSIVINVCGRPALDSQHPSQVGFQLGQTCRSHTLQVAVSGKYRMILSGEVTGDIVVYDEEYKVIAIYTDIENQSTGYMARLDVILEAGKTYIVELYSFQSWSFDVPKKSIILSFEMDKVVKSTGVSIAFEGRDPLKVDGNTYYYLSNDGVINAYPVFEGGPYAEYETYHFTTSNPHVIGSSGGILSSGRCNFLIGSVGTAEISLTTASSMRDSVTIVVLDPNTLVPGDVDLDGAVTKNDISLLYSVLKGHTARTRIYDYADINEDNELDADDLQMMWDVVGGLPFVDVSSTDWFYAPIEYNYNSKVMTGMNEIHFGPYDSLSRAQFALILYRMEGSPKVDVENPFADIIGNEWYADAVLWANSVGIVSGFKVDATFRPVEQITREQMVTMMYRYANYLEIDTTKSSDYDDFVDADSVSEYAQDAMKWAVGSGILTGKISEEGAMLAPWGATARAEAAAIIQRFSENR